MSWLSSIAIGLITAAFGCLGAGFVATKCVRWYRISGFEGGSGYYVIALGLLGIFVGLIVGIVSARIVAGWETPGFLNGLGVGVGAMAGLVAVAGLLAWFAADLDPEIDGQGLELLIEVRGPKDFVVPTQLDEYGAFAAVYVPHGRWQPQGELRLKEARQVDGRWVVPATVPLRTRVGNKYLRVYFNKENDPMFSLPLRRQPNAKDFNWSAWVDSAWNVGTPEPPPEGKFNMRFRVQTIVPPPPGPTQAEVDAQRAEEEQEKFEAIPPDAPISEWLPYTRYGAPEDRLTIAIENITTREGFVEELTALLNSADQEVAADALRMIEHIPQPTPALNEPVAATGRAIATLIRNVNATTAEEDPGYHGAANVSVRFSSWMVAVRALREKANGDFTLELREILELSRVRTDSHAMQADVRRVASYYLHQWTGLEPLPTDPKPR